MKIDVEGRVFIIGRDPLNPKYNLAMLKKIGNQ